MLHLKKKGKPFRHLKLAVPAAVLPLLVAGLLMAGFFIAGPLQAADKSLYDRLGGYVPIAATVDDLVDRLYVNGTLNANETVKHIHEKGGQAGFKFIVTAWVVEKTGGPKIYFGRELDEAHAHLGLSDREFDVVMTECKTTFYKFNVPEKEFGELMAMLESYRGEVVSTE